MPDSDDTALLLHKALEKVAFLPFGMLIDQWRWKVFSGEIKPARVQQGAGGRLRDQYQGIIPPVARTEADFDPGAKYHVAANVPYTRYFLARHPAVPVLSAPCASEAGYSGPLHRCSFYGNKAAGAKFMAMLQMGQSQPWPEALKVLTGEEQMDAGAIMEYFAPLKQVARRAERSGGSEAGMDGAGRSVGGAAVNDCSHVTKATGGPVAFHFSCATRGRRSKNSRRDYFRLPRKPMRKAFLPVKACFLGAAWAWLRLVQHLSWAGSHCRDSGHCP